MQRLQGCFCACQFEAVWVTLMTSQINTDERSHYFQVGLEEITDEITATTIVDTLVDKFT